MRNKGVNMEAIIIGIICFAMGVGLGFFIVSIFDAAGNMDETGDKWYEQDK